MDSFLNEILSALQQFHFIRPYWLLAIIPLALFIWLYSRYQTHSRSWASVIDQRLLPHLLQGRHLKKKSTPTSLLLIPGMLVILALSGPAFEKRPQPVFKAQSALVILLDLSRSMDATDIKPSRLIRAHFKINDILKQRKEGQTALIVYAADAFVVSPLTDDANTISSQVTALETSIMPGQGSRLDIALEKARELFKNAGQSRGHIFVISDSINTRSLNIIENLKSENYTLSVLAIGTQEGAPIAAAGGGFVKDNNGSIVVPKLDITSMKQAANAGGGKFSLLTASDRDINKLLSSIHIDKSETGDAQLDASGNKFKTDLWHEEGPWLLLLVIPFAAYAFRKGLIFALLIFILPLPQPAHALDWNSLWQNTNQQAASALEQGNAEKAAELFNDREWKAAAQYKAGQYQQAAETLQDINTADAHYNRGNALAKSGQHEDAINAYDKALELEPDHEDAKFNKKLVQQAQQQQSSQNNQQDDNEQNKQPNNQDQQSQSGQQNNQPGEGAQEDPRQAEQQNQQQANQDQSGQNQNEQNQSDSSNQQAEQQSTETQQAEQQNSAEDQPAEGKQAQSLQDAEPDLDQQRTQQWLKKIPDDPGGLLRRKFKYQYGRDAQQSEQDAW